MEIIRRPGKSRNDRFKVFNNENLGSVRTFNIEGEPWFCLKDVCEILEIGNPSDVKKRLKPDGVDTIEVGINTGIVIQKINMNFINEANLYRTIMKSRKKEAELFADWIFSEVIPSIRKTGKYAVTENLTEEEKKKELLIGIVLADNETQRAMALSRYNEEYVKPIEIESRKYREFLDRNGTLTSKQIASRLGTSAEFLNRIMNYLGIIVKNGSDWMPQKKYGGTGIMKLVETSFIVNGMTVDKIVHRWTPEGADLCEKVLIENNVIIKAEEGRYKENEKIASLIRSAHKMYQETGRRTYRIRGTLITGLKFLTGGK